MSSYVELWLLCWQVITLPCSIHVVVLLNEWQNSAFVEVVVWQGIAKLPVLTLFSFQISQQLTAPAMVVFWHFLNMKCFKPDGTCTEFLLTEQVHVLCTWCWRERLLYLRVKMEKVIFMLCVTHTEKVVWWWEILFVLVCCFCIIWNYVSLAFARGRTGLLAEKQGKTEKRKENICSRNWNLFWI